MAAAPDVLIIRGVQWSRCGFAAPEDTTVRASLDDGIVSLAPVQPERRGGEGGSPFVGGFAGIAFDRHCRAFHPRPEDGGIEYLLSGLRNALGVPSDRPHPFPITGPQRGTGGFASSAELPQRPIALGCDEADYLYIADAGETPAVWLVDIWQAEVARRLALPAPPVDLAVFEGRATVLLAPAQGGAPGLIALGPCDRPVPVPWPADLAAADRISLARGPAGPRALLLVAAGTDKAEIVVLDDTAIRYPVAFATDLWLGDADADRRQEIVVARRPGEAFLRLRLRGRVFDDLKSPLAASGYDGRGIARAPDGRIAYWTARGLRHAAAARVRRETKATVMGFALDSGTYGNIWGRVLVDACVPEGTAIGLRCITGEEIDFADAVPRAAPAGDPPVAIAEPDRTPLVSAAAWQLEGRPALPQALYRDPLPPPTTSSPTGGFVTYDVPVIAPPGRFLWLAIDLAGNGAKTPRIRGIRVERTEPDLLGRLPKVLWRDPKARDFLGRYLATPAAMLAEWASAASLRHRLFDPRTTAAENLEWLGSMLGLAMDPCWSETARRTMLGEATALFRIRGTVAGLTRMIEILTSGRVIIVEKFRLRGGGVVGNPEATLARSVLGGGFRVGGAIGHDGETALAGLPSELPSEAAHRFTVMIAARLSDEQMGCVRRLVEAHKPAHTLVDICTVETGMRVGLGLHVGLASAVGRNSGSDRLTAGASVLGRGGVLGRPELDRPGTPAGLWQDASGRAS